MGRIGNELKPRSEWSACWRRWVTASKETRVFFAGYGLFTRIAICGLASQSRWGNHRLESRVRENRTHGSEGGDGESRFRPLSNIPKDMLADVRQIRKAARSLRRKNIIDSLIRLVSLQIESNKLS